MARASTCPACGTKVRAGRDRCPRCREALAVALPDPGIAAASSRRLLQISAGLGGAFLLLVAVLWFMQDPAPSQASLSAGPPADPFASRRQAATEAVAAPADAVTAPADRPFLDAAGAGSAAYSSGDYASALAKFQEAVAKNPQDSESLSNLGQILVRLNRPEEAIPYFERAIALLPSRWTYQFNLARTLGLVGRMDESIASYRKAQQLYPDDYVTTFNLALTLHKKGDEAGAVTEYLRAIELQPEDASFRKALGVSYERLQKGPEAAAAYHEYLRLSPGAPDADTVRARIAQLEGSAAPQAQAPPAAGR